MIRFHLEESITIEKYINEILEESINDNRIDISVSMKWINSEEKPIKFKEYYKGKCQSIGKRNGSLNLWICYSIVKR